MNKRITNDQLKTNFENILDSPNSDLNEISKNLKLNLSDLENITKSNIISKNNDLNKYNQNNEDGENSNLKLSNQYENDLKYNIN